MKTTRMIMPGKFARTAIAAASGLCLASGLYAQAAQPIQSNQDEGEPVKMEKFVVTGSYIPVAGTATAIPVMTLDSQDIERTGINTSLLEVLKKTMPQFTGSLNLGSTNADIASGNTGGGSNASFRNTQTLVLVNGRRAAYSPILASGGYQFVDLNLIPLSAVERVEVLQDGASAIYGTDAVSGVVNIIMKTDYQGFEAGGRYAFSDNDGNYAERKFWLVGGASNDKTSITLSAEWTKTDPLFQYDREFSAFSYGTPTFAGVINDDETGEFYVLNPSLNAPPLNTNLTRAQLIANGTYIPVDTDNLISGRGTERQYAFNLANYVTLLIGNERQSATANFEHKMTDTITVFGDLIYTQTESFSQLNAQPISAAVADSDPTNPFTGTATADSPNGTIRARNRFVQFPRQYYYDSTSIRGILGIKGELNNGFMWEAAANRNRVEQGYRNANVIDTAARIAAVSSGALNMFARQQAPGAIAATGMFGTALGTAITTLETYDARVAGNLFTLPAGDLGFAVGGDFRTETLSQTADRNSQTATFGWDSATTLDPVEADRDISSVFINLRAPLIGGDMRMPGFHLLEVEAALRHEKYSDTDDPTVPKVTLRWLPFGDEFAFRGTYSESFAAPSLYQLFGPGGSGSTDSLSLNRLGGGSPITGQANLRTGSNPNLRPSESENFTLGFVWSPKSVKGFSLSVDYYQIEQTDLVARIGEATILQDVELNGASSVYAPFVRFGPIDDITQFDAGAPVTAPGQVGTRPIGQVYVTDRSVNIATQRLAGVDLTADYTWVSDSLGRFNFGLAAGWYDYFKVRGLPTATEDETVGLATIYNGTIPEWQTYLSMAWDRGPWNANIGWNHIPAVTDENGIVGSADPTEDEKVEAFNTVDIGFGYTFGSSSRWFNGFAVRIGANNVFNEMPPSAKVTFANGNADLATYGAVGRLIYVEAKYKF
jgi:iron complex outermembrane recepter protein